MQKTKLGISIGLFGAALYFIGLLGIIPLVLLAGYVLLFEENEWLKWTAVKAVAVVLFFTIISSVIGLVTNSSSFLTDVVYLFNGTIDIGWLTRILSICRTVLSFVQVLLMLILGFRALKQRSVKIGAVDKTIGNNL